MGSDLFDLTAIIAALFELAGKTVIVSIWVLAPFSIGYGLPLATLGRRGLNVMWVLAALTLLSLAWALNARPGPFGLIFVALSWIVALAYGLVLGCAIRELSLRRNFSKSFSRALAIRGFATMPLIVAVLMAQLLWVSREPNAACLAAIQTVDVAGTRYRLPNVPFVVMPGESKWTADWVINQRLRNRCGRAKNSEAAPMRSGFALNLVYWGQQYEITKKICSNSAVKPRWVLDVCAATSQGVLAKMHESFAATRLPLELEISEIPTTTERPYTLVEEHRRNLQTRAKHPYRELPGTSKFSIYADGEKPRYGETRSWISNGSAEPEAFACWDIGNNVDSLQLRCKVRYARGATFIIYEFEAQRGREEDTVAQVNSRVLDILTELAAPP